MILPSTCSALHNIQDKFYYNGIEINKANFDITEFALVCDRINDFKYQIRQEKDIKNIKETILSGVSIGHTNIILLCTIKNKEYYFGLYDDTNKKIIPLTKEIFLKLNDAVIWNLSYDLNRTSKLILNNLVNKTMIKDKTTIISFDNYISNIKNLSNSFQHTYELEFINGYKEFILTDEELKQSIIER